MYIPKSHQPTSAPPEQAGSFPRSTSLTAVLQGSIPTLALCTPTDKAKRLLDKDLRAFFHPPSTMLAAVALALLLLVPAANSFAGPTAFGFVREGVRIGQRSERNREIRAKG